MLSVTLLALAIFGLASAQNQLDGDWPPFYDKHTASPLLSCPAYEETWKAPQEYLDMRTHDVTNRDHGCADFPDRIEHTFHCTEFWIKNRYSAQNVKPNQILLEFQYHKDVHHQRKFVPAVTWVQHVTPWKVHACAAVPGGHSFMALSKGKLRWLAVYNIQQTSREQSGVIDAPNYTTGKKCTRINFPVQFDSRPYVKLTQHAMCQQAGFEPNMVWIKTLSATGFEMCWAEWNQFSAFHRNHKINWYATTQITSEDQGRQVGSVTFNANDPFPTNMDNLNNFYCKNVTLQRWMFPCPAILLQVVEQSDQVCETEMVAWAPIVHENFMTVCYQDRRGLAGRRKVDVEIQYLVFGYQDGCQTRTCPRYRECIHPTWNTVDCGCITKCPTDKDEVCGSDMVTYDNKCLLEKAACESKSGVYYSHPGKCETLVRDSDRVQTVKEAGCNGFYCVRVNMKAKTFYEHAELHVQVSVNWMNNGETVHDASTSWVEDVTGNGFKACVLEAGRRDLAAAPYINWFAYQGKMEGISADVIEVGDWMSGTHCVPLHQRKLLKKPDPWMAPECMDYVNRMGGMSDDREAGMGALTGMDADGEGMARAAMSMMRQNRGMLYDHHLMAAIYGNHHHEWFKRMRMGYGAERMKITAGMKMAGATVMLTVQRGDGENAMRDSLNTWLEYDNQTQEAYICLREQTNFAGKHSDVKVRWMVVHEPKIMGFGYHHNVMFKPHYFAPMYSNYAFCQMKQYKADDMDLPNSATVLVSLTHKIPRRASMESMKKHIMHGMEVNKGMASGNADFDNPKVVESWMMPHMWRANLTGWMPTDRISKDTDYSAWIEGYNMTHVKVCQKSIYSGFHFEGVSVSILTIPDRCPAGYCFLKNEDKSFCAKYMDDCTLKSQASQACRRENAYLGTPRDQRETYLLSNLAMQEPIQIGLNDNARDGNFVRDSGHDTLNHLPLTVTNYTNFAAGQPDGGIGENCVELNGRNTDYTYNDYNCASCRKYTCMVEAPFMHCDGYCMNCGRCTRNGPFQYSCECVPPYTGARCETNMETGHVGEEQAQLMKAKEEAEKANGDDSSMNY